MTGLRGGLALAGRFYAEAVRPLVADIPHAAALLGDGSEVLGYDDQVSTDHDFGPRLQLFVADHSYAKPVHARLDALADEFEGWPVRFTDSGGRAAYTHVQVTTASMFFSDALGVDPLDGMSAVDWLLAPTQILATLTRGAVFCDPSNEVRRRQATLAWYPDDVWRYVLASAWLRISQEEAFVGRAGGSGDDLGSRVVATRVARDMMRLGFLICRVYAPYSKWIGRGFSELPLAPRIGPALETAIAAPDWRSREAALTAAGETLGHAVNDLGLALYVDPAPRQFHDRDIRVSASEEFAIALVASIHDAQMRDVLAHQGTRGSQQIGRLTGSVDQFIDSTDVLCDVARRRALRSLLLGSHARS